MNKLPSTSIANQRFTGGCPIGFGSDYIATGGA
jgi:hypothetical protein